MSLEDLQADLDMNIGEAAKLNGALVTAPELANHLNKVVWPFIKNLVNELEEVDGSVADLYQNAEDVLQPETAGRIAAVIAVATGLITKQLVPRLSKDKPEEKKVLAAIQEWIKLAAEAGAEIEEITVQTAEGIDPEEEDDDEDEEDEEDEPDDGDDDSDDDDEDDDEEDE